MSHASPFADPLLRDRAVLSHGIRLHHLARLGGGFPLAFGRHDHLLFLPTAGGGRVGHGPHPAPLLPSEILVVLGPQPSSPHWVAATGLLLLLEDAPLRAMLARLEGRPLAGGGTLRLRDPLLALLIRGLGEAVERGDRGPVTGPLGDALVARLADAMLARVPVVQVDGGGLAAWRLRRVEGFAGANLGRTIRLAELAQVAGLSTFHFSRAFRQTTGHAPQAWLLRQRLERAQELLAGGGLPLPDAAIEAGFCSHAHLTATFRRLLGTTPSAWRATLPELALAADADG